MHTVYIRGIIAWNTPLHQRFVSKLPVVSQIRVVDRCGARIGREFFIFIY